MWIVNDNILYKDAVLAGCVKGFLLGSWEVIANGDFHSREWLTMYKRCNELHPHPLPLSHWERGVGAREMNL
jgi:hypothetical protein